MDGVVLLFVMWGHRRIEVGHQADGGDLRSQKTAIRNQIQRNAYHGEEEQQYEGRRERGEHVDSGVLKWRVNSCVTYGVCF